MKGFVKEIVAPAECLRCLAHLRGYRRLPVRLHLGSHLQKLFSVRYVVVIHIGQQSQGFVACSGMAVVMMFMAVVMFVVMFMAVVMSLAVIMRVFMFMTVLMLVWMFMSAVRDRVSVFVFQDMHIYLPPLSFIRVV